VTLASNRGVNGSAGALLYTEEDVDDTFYLHGTGRFTGIRLRGAHPGSDTGGPSDTSGVKMFGDGELDNCKVFGFTYDGVGPENGSRGHIHHNVIVENNKDGLGYGVHVEDADPVIEYNYFNYNRHSVAMSEAEGSYTLRYNHFGPKEVMHNIDVHSPAGGDYDIHNNIVETVYREWDGNLNHAVDIRDVPNQAVITDNWFFNDNAPDPNGDPDVGGQTIVQENVSDWTNMSFYDNHYGEDASVTYSDIIPGYDGFRSN
jgi:hypothetical protein